MSSEDDLVVAMLVRVEIERSRFGESSIEWSVQNMEEELLLLSFGE